MPENNTFDIVMQFDYGSLQTWLLTPDPVFKEITLSDWECAAPVSDWTSERAPNFILVEYEHKFFEKRPEIKWAIGFFNEESARSYMKSIFSHWLDAMDEKKNCRLSISRDEAVLSDEETGNTTMQILSTLSDV